MPLHVTSQFKTQFKYIDRGYRKSIVLIPGWATDFKIFSHIVVPFNYIIPIQFSPVDFSGQLIRFLENKKMSTASLLGWSMGGFCAADFSAQYPDHIDHLLLLGMRRKYNMDDIEVIIGYIKKNKSLYLQRFFSQCFADAEEKRLIDWRLIEGYCNNTKLDYLLETLEYLKISEIHPEKMVTIKNIHFYHGESDTIASLDEAQALHKMIPHSRLEILRGVGHMPFLHKKFQEIIYKQNNRHDK